MKLKNKLKGFGWQLVIICGVLLTLGAVSCGKATTGSSATTNIYYQVLNLSPDLFPVYLYVDFARVNANAYVFNVPQGYFYVPSTDTPYQIRTASTTGTTLFNRDDVLKSGAKYSLFIVGNAANKSVQTIFTTDTASVPTTGRGKVRFVDASPTGTSGLDMAANGTVAFNKIIYPNYSKFIELPVGNYDFTINATGSSIVLKTLTSVTIQDGRLYTIYAYGYTNRIDSAAFNAAIITNK